MNTIVIALSTVIVYAAYRFGRFSAKMDIRRKEVQRSHADSAVKPCNGKIDIDRLREAVNNHGCAIKK